MKRTVQMAKNHGPAWRAKPRFKGFRKERRDVWLIGTVWRRVEAPK